MYSNTTGGANNAPGFNPTAASGVRSRIASLSAYLVAQAERLSAFWIVAGAIAAISLLWRQNGATPDVSWLSDMCGRMLDGEGGWIDIFETTPPVPTLIYMPGVVLARALQTNPEFGVFATAYIAAFAALYATVATLPPRLDGSGPANLIVAGPAAFVLFILSNDAFAQREWFAAAFALPAFAVFIARRQTGEWPSLTTRCVAAAFAGLSFAIKPPLFAAPFFALALLELIRTRSLAFLFPSMLPLAGAIGAATTALSLAAYPAYLGGVTTLMRDVYVPIHASFAISFFNTAFLGVVVALAVTLAIAVRRRLPDAAFVGATLTLTFCMVYFAQGKYFWYHIQPASLFAMIALAAALWPMLAGDHKANGFSTPDCVVYAALTGIAIWATMAGFDDKRRPVSEMAWAQNLERPTAMAVSPDISTGFPLATYVGARWIDRIHGQWVVNYTRIELARDGLNDAERARYQRYYDSELARTRALIQTRKPELIFKLATERHAWLAEALAESDPTLFDAYEEIGREGNVAILRRQPEAD